MLNEALKQIRLFHQVKQSDLADSLGISKSYLSEIESNKKPVSMDLLKKYAEYFSIPASSLMLFSENIDTSKRSEKLKFQCAKKVVSLMEWINASKQQNP